MIRQGTDLSECAVDARGRWEGDTPVVDVVLQRQDRATSNRGRVAETRTPPEQNQQSFRAAMKGTAGIEVRTPNFYPAAPSDRGAE